MSEMSPRTCLPVLPLSAPCSRSPSARELVLDTELVEHARDHELHQVVDSGRPVIEAGRGGKHDGSRSRDAKHVSRWISLSGVSRGTRTTRRRSLSATSAARSTSERDAPAAIAESVPIEHGQMTIPLLRADPDAGAAPRSPSSNTVTSLSQAFAPTRARNALEVLDAGFRGQEPQAVLRHDEPDAPLGVEQRLKQLDGVGRARKRR